MNSLRRSYRTAVNATAVAIVVALTLTGCSLGIGDDAREGTGSAGEAGVGSAPTTAPTGLQSVKVGKTAWYGGLKLTFEEVSYDPAATNATVTAKVLVENLSGKDYQPNLPVLLSTGSQQYDGNFAQLTTTVGARQSSRLDLEFRAEELPTGLAGASFIIGQGTETQSIVPIGEGELIANEPRAVLTDGKKTHFRDVNVWFTKCEVRADLVPDHHQAKRDHVVLACLYNLQFTKEHDSSQFWGEENLRLKMPDGTVVGSTERDSAALYTTEILPDQYVAFQLPAPATGAYALQIIQRFSTDKPSAKTILEVPVTL